MNITEYCIEIQTPFGPELCTLLLSNDKCSAIIERGSSDFIDFTLSDIKFNGVIKTDIPFDCQLHFDSQINNDEIFGCIKIDKFASVSFTGRIKK